jgi:hypothetical protein
VNERRGAWYLLTGLVLGLVVGLVYSLFISPVEFARIAPQSLGGTYKDSYRVLIALAYDADGDIGRAQARLALLKDENPVEVLAAQAQRLLAEGGQADEARALVSLGDDLLIHLSATPTLQPTTTPTSPAENPAGPAETQALFTATIDPEHAVLTPTGAAGTAQSQAYTPLASITPGASPLPDSLVNAAFSLDETHEDCSLPAGTSGSSLSVLQIEVLDQDGIPLPGIPVVVTWDGGEDRFFTGLHPQVSPGYADFEMQPDITYSVQVGNRGQVENGINAVVCSGEEGSDYAGALWMTFVQP